MQEPFTCREWVDLHSGAHPQPQPLARALTLTLPLTLPLPLPLTLTLPLIRQVLLRRRRRLHAAGRACRQDYLLPVHDGLRCAQRRQARALLGLGLALSRPPPALQTYHPGLSPRTRPQPQASPAPIQACALPALPDRQLNRGTARAAAPPALVPPALVRGAPGDTGAAAPAAAPHAGGAARAARAAAARLHRLLGRCKATSINY